MADEIERKWTRILDAVSFDKLKREVDRWHNSDPSPEKCGALSALAKLLIEHVEWLEVELALASPPPKPTQADRDWAARIVEQRLRAHPQTEQQEGR